MKYYSAVRKPLGHKIFVRLVFIAAVLSFFPPFAQAASDIHQTKPETPRQMLKRAEKFLRRGDFEAAEKLMREVVTADPLNTSAKLRLAYVNLKQRRLNEAFGISFEIAKNEPQNSEAFAVLGHTLLNSGRFDDARQLLRNSLMLDRKLAFAWAGLGQLEFYENRIDEALKDLREAVYREPSSPDYIFSLAQVAARAEQYNEAATAYKKFLQLSQNTDDERRARIKGLIDFLNFLGQRQSLYDSEGTQTVLPFKLIGNRPVIQLSVNNHDEPLNFVLDTGSGITVISEETAQRLDIDPVAKGGFAKGLGGAGRFPIVYGFVRRISLGDVKVRNVPVYIRRFHNSGMRVDGYIGLSLISKFLTTVDYGNLTFSLRKTSDETAPADQVGIPLRLTSSGFLSGEVQLDGIDQPLNFIVDTGASVSVISDEVASHAAVTPFASGEKMRVIGSAGITDGVSSFLLPRLSFGEHTRKKVAAIALDLDLINETSGFEQAGILGGNFLRNYRLTFDFRHSRVTFQPVGENSTTVPN